MSDMHLGEEDSVLTKLKDDAPEVDPYEAGPVLVKLVDCLKALISKNEKKQKPKLILAGDILELALSSTSKAAMVFERFLELVMKPGKELFEEILYIPGNHDHHLWEMARESQYVDYTIVKGRGRDLKDPYHNTRMFKPKPLPSFLLSRLIATSKSVGDFKLDVAYPNFGLVKPDGSRCVIFHHGHFTESLYMLMTTGMNLVYPDRRQPETVWQIEAENFAWIDFFWSTLGRQGDVGGRVESIYESMCDPKRFKKLLSTFADSIAREYDIPYVAEFLEPRLVRGLVHFLAGMLSKKERGHTDDALSPDGHKGLWSYMTGPLRNQILEDHGSMPNDVTFVYGHTHKPFERDLDFRGYYPQWVNTYNTGGWVVDNLEPKKLHGGAVILVDENLNAVSLRMYNESADPGDYKVRIAESTHEGQQKSAFHKRILTLVKPSRDPWKSFSSEVERAVRTRSQNLRVRISKSY
jgi:hypothetical protein